jgi:site-specific DNA-methyltransferase (adenine-specific)
MINYNPDVLSCLANLSNDEVFTPPEVANSMLDMLPEELWSNPNAKFLDPACKTGVFLREIAKRLLKGLEQQIPDLQQRIDHIFQHQLYAIAITELTGLLARRSLYCSKTADGKYSITAFDHADGNIKFERTQHSWINGRCKYCGASQSEYDRGDELETHAYQFIHTNNPEKIFNMKFDVIIGNPPYQLSDGGNGASASPLYDKFVENAKKLNPKFLSMIIPSRWFAGGKGLDDFRNKMLNDNRIRIITDYPNAKECFPESSIGGGVCFFLWDRDNPGDCSITNISNGKSNTMVRPLNEYPVFVRYNDAIDIIKKVECKSSSYLSSIVSSRNPFGCSSSLRGYSKPFDNGLTLYSSKGIGYIEQKDISKGFEYVNNYKIMISKVTAEHAGEPDSNGQFSVLSRTEILNPNEVCTDSYLIIGSFDSKEIARNCFSYLQTKVVRFLLLLSVSSINLSKDKFNFVPIMDFSKQWTDEKLYEYYKISDDEVSFIENLIKQK